MNRVLLAGVGGVAVLGLVLAFVLLSGWSSRGGEGSAEAGQAVAADQRREPPADGASGLVLVTYRAEKGFSFFGWDVVASRYAANVGFVPPSGCLADPGGKIVPEGACTGVPAWGDVSGGGTTAAGQRLVIVAVTVSERCYKVLRGDDAWPSARPECAGG